MPKYTALVTITRTNGDKDDIMFDNFQAKSEVKARKIVHKQAEQYIRHCRDESNPPLHWEIRECIRTVLIAKGGRKEMPKAVKQALNITKKYLVNNRSPQNDCTTSIMPRVISKAFKQEHRGSVLDAVNFKLPKYDRQCNT